MPITLGCPSCGKKFRARDESAGKKVKCPYCQSAVQVSAPGESGVASESAVAPAAPAVASPTDWGAAAPAPASMPLSPPPAPPPVSEPRREPEPARQPPSYRNEEPKQRPRPAADWNGSAQETPDKVLAAGWKRARRGLFWVQFALCWVMLIGFVELGKSLYERKVGPLPKGDGADWVTIDGFINSGGQDAIPVLKEEMINLATYGVPGALGLLLATFGRLVASGAPRRSGARGLFGLSSIATLLALVAGAAAVVFSTSFKDMSMQGRQAFILLLPLSEFLFFVGLACCGVALKRPGTARTVGFLAILLTAMVAVREFGWSYILKELPPTPPADIKLYTQATFAGCWFLLIFVYWLAIRGVRRSAREFMEAAADRA